MSNQIRNFEISTECKVGTLGESTKIWTWFPSLGNGEAEKSDSSIFVFDCFIFLSLDLGGWFWLEEILTPHFTLGIAENGFKYWKAKEVFHFHVIYRNINWCLYIYINISIHDMFCFNIERNAIVRHIVLLLLLLLLLIFITYCIWF